MGSSNVAGWGQVGGFPFCSKDLEVLDKMQQNHHKICIFQVKMEGKEREQQDAGEQKEALRQSNKQKLCQDCAQAKSLRPGGRRWFGATACPTSGMNRNKTPPRELGKGSNLGSILGESGVQGSRIAWQGRRIRERKGSKRPTSSSPSKATSSLARPHPGL